MSDRQYVPGEYQRRGSLSPPLVQTLRDLIPGVLHGLPTRTNRLGLYLLNQPADAEAGKLLSPRSHGVITEPSNARAYRAGVSPLNPANKASALALGGTIRYGMKYGVAPSRLETLLKAPFFRFGFDVGFRMLDLIVQQALISDPDITAEAIGDICSKSFGATAGLLVKQPRDVTYGIEIALGIKQYEHGGPTPIGSAVRVTDQHAELTADTQLLTGADRCDGMYITDENGTSIVEAIWRRATDMVIALPWLRSRHK